MSTTFQFKGGTTSQQNSYVGYPREITIDTTLNQIRVHDGQTPGGTPVAIAGGASASFTSNDGKLITVVNGIITSIV